MAIPVVQLYGVLWNRKRSRQSARRMGRPLPLLIKARHLAVSAYGAEEADDEGTLKWATSPGRLETKSMPKAVSQELPVKKKYIMTRLSNEEAMTQLIALFISMKRCHECWRKPPG